jgi:lysophospholipase L1-like esterase
MNAGKILRAASLSAVLLAAGAAARAQEFTKYVALGDSITAGFQGACLVARHQNASYPAIVAQQLGVTDFELPLFAEGPLSANLAINKCLGFVFTGTTVGVGPVSDMLGPTNLGLPRPYDNLGIPGANVRDLLNLRQADPNGNTANRFGAAILRNGSNVSPLFGTNAVEQALVLQPDLVSVWIGNNDVLGAVLAGVALEGVTLTPVASFEADFTALLGALQANGRTLVVLNVPDVDAVPFANTIPPFVVDPTGAPVIVGGSTIPLLGPGNAANPCPGGAPACPVPPGTRVTLQAQPLLAQGFGIPCAVAPQLPHCNAPLPDGGFTPPATLSPGVLLFPDEIAAIKARVDAYNAIIASVAQADGAVQVDIHGIFERIVEEGYEVGGITLTPALGTGGLFSADGFHPSNVAHAIIADEIVKALNAALDGDIPEPNLAATLFAPDVPPASGAAVGFDPSAIAFRQLSGVFGPVAEGIGILEPRLVVTPPRRDLPPTAGPRVVERPAVDRSR